MLALMVVEIDQAGGDGDRLKGGLADLSQGADKGDHGAIVVGIGADIEQAGAGDGADGVGDGVVDGGVTAVAEIGYAFNELGHGKTLLDSVGLDNYATGDYMLLCRFY
jgi:hypothetical protein